MLVARADEWTSDSLGRFGFGAVVSWTVRFHHRRRRMDGLTRYFILAAYQLTTSPSLIHTQRQQQSDFTTAV